MGVFLLLLAAQLCFAQEVSPEKLIEAGHWKRARAQVERRLREAPADANALFLSSQIRNAFGDHESPPKLAERAVELDGGVARYHRQLAEVQGVMAQHAGVFKRVLLARRFRREIEIAVRLDPQNVQALRDVLEFHLLAPGLLGGDPNKAETTAQQIAAIDPTEGFLARARIAELRRDAAQTESMLRRAASIRPLSYKAQMALGEFYLAPEHRRDTAAEELGRAALSSDRGRIGAYCILASIYANRQDWSALDAILSSAAQEVPDDSTPYYRAAEQLLRDGHDPARAERHLRHYLRQETEGNQPTAADAHWKLGLALLSMDHKANAIEEWKAAVRLDPESPATSELRRVRHDN